MITKKRTGPLLVLSYGSVGSLEGYYLSPTTFHVTSLYVDPEWRRQGIGTQLLTRCLLELKKNKVQQVTLDDCSGGRCYTRLGFVYLKPGYPEMVLHL